MHGYDFQDKNGEKILSKRYQKLKHKVSQPPISNL
jgi:hypothetical protein